MASASEETLYDSLTTRRKTEVYTENVGAINALSVEQDEHRFLLSGGADSSIHVYDLDSKVVKDLNEGTEALAPDNITTYECVATVPRKFGHRYGVSGVSWWPFDSGMFISSSFDGTLKVWDSNATEEGEVYAFDLEHRVYTFDISKTGQHSLIATATQSPLIRLLDLRTTSSSHTLSGHKIGSVQSVKWSPTKPHLLASGGSDGSLRLWDIRRADSCISSLDLNQSHPERTADKTYLTTAPFADRRAHRAAINGLEWLPNGEYLISAGCDEAIRLWDLQVETEERNSLVNFGPLVRNEYPQALYMCVSPQEDPLPSPYLFFPSGNGQILVYDVMTGRLIKQLDRPYIGNDASTGIARTACITARGNGTHEFYSGSMDGLITRWAPLQQATVTGESQTGLDAVGSDSDSDSDYEESASTALDSILKK